MAALEPKAAAGPVRQWKLASAECKQKWGDEVKVTQAKKDAPAFPFPLGVSRVVQRTQAASAWEVWEIKAKFSLLSKPAEGEEPSIGVEFSTDGILPEEVAEGMIKLTLAQWSIFVEKSDKEVNAFPLQQIFAWVEDNYVELLSSVPLFVSRFIAELPTGGNAWKFCLLEPTVRKKVVLTEEEKEAAEAAEIELLSKQLERDLQAAIQKEAWAEERRLQQEEDGGKVPKLSKKEQEEMAAAKRGQGQRTAKTGSRKHKFDPEAHAANAKK